MSGLVRRIVWHPGHLLAGSTVTPTDTSGSYDVLIGSIPFMAAYAPDAPFQRQTAPYKKDQQDQTTEPGEQSLTGWWRRSQTTFHGGAGRDYEEPRTSQDTSATTEFHDSQGVDVWTPGKVTLLPATVTAASSGGDGCIAAGPGVLHWTTNTLKFTSWSGDTPTTTAVTYGGAGNITSVASDGTRYYAATSTAIYAGGLNAGAGAVLWNTGAATVIGWCKQRLMAAIGTSIYELAGGSPPTLPTPKFTHPSANWTWTGFAEGPDAIYAAGYAGDQSAVFQFILDTSGLVPTLSTGITMFTMPTGEQIRSIGTYLNGYVVLGTNRGLRVCPIEPDNSIRLGPLVVNFKTMGVSATANPVLSVTGRDRFVYGALSKGMPDGTSGLVRVDLGNIDQNGLFAWATDLQAHSSADVTGVCVVADRMVFSVSGVGTMIESASSLEASGTLTTGRIRHHTLEPKLFKQVQMRALPLHGNLQCTVIDQSGNLNTLPQIVGIGQGTLDVQNTGLGKQEYVSLKFTLTSSAGQGPTFTGYQLNALPATPRQRQETLILSCYDAEEDRNGNQIKKAGYALQRLVALEALEDAADTVLLQHLTADPLGLLTGLVVIDSVRLVQQRRPGKSNGFGGLLEVVVRRP